jgi:acyl carrier protein
MSLVASPYVAGLMQFLRSIQKPGKSLDNIALEDSLITTGLIDSLAIVQIVLYLEQTYDIDFASIGFDAERLSSISGIIKLIEETR